MNKEKHTVTIPIDDYNKLNENYYLGLNIDKTALVKELLKEILDSAKIVDNNNNKPNVNYIEIHEFKTKNFILHRVKEKIYIKEINSNKQFII